MVSAILSDVVDGNVRFVKSFHGCFADIDITIAMSYFGTFVK